MSLPDFSGPSPIDGKYDVFLSFRGTDTRTGFTTNLYHALCQNEIYTFMDVNLLGEEIEDLFRVIAQSRMAVVIYSKNFASSPWCLKELDTILQHKKEKKMMLTPIFYKVNLDEVKHLTGYTGEYLDKHVAKHGENTVQTWKDAVTNFGRVSGLSYKDNDTRTERDFIEDVIRKIKKKLGECQQHSVQSKDLVISQSSSSHQGGQLEGMVADKQRFTYDEILKITNNLDKLVAETQSGLGDVYSGKINDVAVAVKILPRLVVQGMVSDVGSDNIQTYLRMQCSFRHENLVSLLGYCFDEDEKMAFVFEFIENGHLRKHLSGTSPRVLTWKERLQIAIDIAEGLKYMHGMGLTVTAMGNFQSTDIVFDKKMTAKILLFPSYRDLATNPFFRYLTSLTSYVASFVGKDDRVSDVEITMKMDLHCFARILYELVTGHEAPLTTCDNFIKDLFEDNFVFDSRLGEILTMIAQRNMSVLQYNCAQCRDIKQPTSSSVLEDLKKHLTYWRRLTNQ